MEDHLAESSVSGGTCVVFIWSDPDHKLSLVLEVCLPENWVGGPAREAFTGWLTYLHLWAIL